MTVRLLAALLAFAATDPAGLAGSAPVQHALIAAVAAVIGFYAGAPVTSRPVIRDFRSLGRIARHRATVLALGCLLLMAVLTPPAWLAALDAALLLGYLLAADAVAGGPPAHRDLRGTPAAAAVVATGVVLAVALAPIHHAAHGGWARLGAAALIAVVALSFVFLATRRR